MYMKKIFESIVNIIIMALAFIVVFFAVAAWFKLVQGLWMGNSETFIEGLRLIALGLLTALPMAFLIECCLD